MLNKLRRELKWLKDPKNYKYFMFSVCMVWLYALLMACAIENYVDRESQREHEEYVIEQYRDVLQKMSELDDISTELKCQYHDNILLIYDRVQEISKESPNEVRDKVIEGINLEDDPLVVEASVLALLHNYPELQEDVKIQKRCMEVMCLFFLPNQVSSLWSSYSV